MSATPQAPRRIAELCDEAVHELTEATRRIAELQHELMPAGLHSGDQAVINKTVLWQRLEMIDDCIHKALTKLGD